MNVTKLRVRYAETDQMGIVYHGNYLAYFEIGRVELIRSCGYSYAAMERDGFRLPVTEIGVRYRAPARYDDVLIVETRVTEVGAARVRFEYRVLREGDESLLVEGHSVLACVTPEGRPCRMPDPVRTALRAKRDEASGAAPE